jgi:hypothetical protein
MAKVGERVRLYFHNVGPNDQASIHVIGAIFDRVWYEGNPRNEMRGMQTAFIGSSNGAVLEFIVPDATCSWTTSSPTRRGPPSDRSLACPGPAR